MIVLLILIMIRMKMNYVHVLLTAHSCALKDMTGVLMTRLMIRMIMAYAMVQKYGDALIH